MHRLIIEYSEPTLTQQEMNILTSTISEWLIDYDVYGCQSASNVIEFDTDSMRTLAIMWLCDEKQIERLRVG
jgi:hypothetical protein